MSHFECIGFQAASPDELRRVVGHAIDRARPPDQLGQAAKNYLWFQDPSGGAIAARLNSKGAVDCMTPFFSPASPTQWRVRTSSPHLDDECLHCSGADCDLLEPSTGDMCTRTAVQWALFEPYQVELKKEGERVLDVAGFASKLTLCRDREAFEIASSTAFGPPEPDKEPFRLAENAFMPWGMFGNDANMNHRARALVAGSVENLARPVNSLSGASFRHVRLKTIGGLLLDIVAPDEPLPAERPTLALAEVWLVGRPVLPPQHHLPR